MTCCQSAARGEDLDINPDTCLGRSGTLLRTQTTALWPCSLCVVSWLSREQKTTGMSRDQLLNTTPIGTPTSQRRSPKHAQKQAGQILKRKPLGAVHLLVRSERL